MAQLLGPCGFQNDPGSFLLGNSEGSGAVTVPAWIPQSLCTDRLLLGRDTPGTSYVTILF